MVYSMIDEATRFHNAEVVVRQTAMDLFEAIMRGWIRWAGQPKFVLVDPHPAQINRVFVDNLGIAGHHGSGRGSRSALDPRPC